MSANEMKAGELKWVYARAFANSLSDGMVSPFIYVYALRIGASPSEVGWMRSFNNLFTYGLQIPWGRLADRLNSRVSLIVFADVVASLLWIPIALTLDPKLLSLSLSLHFLVASASVPAWNALLGALIPAPVRGFALSTVSTASLSGSLIATAASGPLMDLSGGSPLVPVSLAAISGSFGSVLLLRVREPKVKKTAKLGDIASLFKMSEIPKLLSENADFELFIKLTALQGFFMTFAWPLFSVTMAETLNLSMTEVGILSIINILTTMLAQPLMGRLVDRFGKMSIMFLHYISLPIVPLSYALVSDFLQLAACNVLFGVVISSSGISVSAYLLDIVPEERVSEFIATYNMVLGISYFMGSAFGGNFTELARAVLGKRLGLQVGYAISTLGRLVSGLMFLKIKKGR